jgi:hypothetical protein
MGKLWETYLSLPEDQVVIMYALTYARRILAQYSQPPIRFSRYEDAAKPSDIYFKLSSWIPQADVSASTLDPFQVNSFSLENFCAKRMLEFAYAFPSWTI